MYVRDLAVLPEFWGRKIGENLLFTALSLFDRDVKTIRLLTRAINKSARGFYTENLGFEICKDEDLSAEIPQERRHLYVGYAYDLDESDYDQWL